MPLEQRRLVGRSRGGSGVFVHLVAGSAVVIGQDPGELRNVLVRHLTGDPPELASRATAYLASATELLLSDLIVAETIDVLESFDEVPRGRVADAMRSLVAFRSIVTVDPALLLPAIEVDELDRIDLAESYLVACAETTGVNQVASFDRSIDRVTTIERVEPPPTS